jgi:16S rRNA G1207 methylase RsmC
MVTQTQIDEMKASLSAGVQIAVAPQLYETPRDLAKHMIYLADIGPGETVLEPSAGTGVLVGAMLAAGVTWQQISIVEQNAQLADALATKYRRVYPGDFLERCAWELGGPFDKIVMNPPFIQGADIKHIEHALTMLKPDGRLVGICAGGPRQERKLQPLASDWEPLEPGTFKSAGTMVNSVLFTIEG